MSTRGGIARQSGKGFRGRFHHWDSYPEGLGATLFNLRNYHFQGDTKAMLKVLIDDHPAGWSTINGKDFNIEPAYMDYTNENEQLWEVTPLCYCHGARSEPSQELTEKNASNCGCEYIYVFTNDGNTMYILSSFGSYGKMIGAFGCGDPDAVWKPIAKVDLNGDEPDWENIMQSQSERGDEQYE